jgi:hypothetical protein
MFILIQVMVRLRSVEGSFFDALKVIDITDASLTQSSYLTSGEQYKLNLSSLSESIFYQHRGTSTVKRIVIAD